MRNRATKAAKIEKDPRSPAHENPVFSPCHGNVHPLEGLAIEVSQNNHISGQRHWGRLQQVRTLLSRRPRPMNSVKVYIKVSNWPVTDADR